MTNRRPLPRTALALLGVFALWLALSPPMPVTAQGPARQAPIFEVDPFWPRPLPHHWVTGSPIGLSVDAVDQVWTIHRPNTVEDTRASVSAPHVGGTSALEPRLGGRPGYVNGDGVAP